MKNQTYNTLKQLLLAGTLSMASISIKAVPILQVGAPGGPGQGTYANYTPNNLNPTESDTAIISGNILYAGGAYTNGNPELLIGGRYGNSGADWSDFGFNTVFDGAGAILMATVENGTLGGSNSITVNGQNAIFTASTLSGFAISNPPGNHDPVKDNNYLFFDIGNFAQNINMPNFVDESISNQLGEIKSLTLSISGYQWVHFDLMALVTEPRGRSRIETNFDGNPGSHDVTWKAPGNTVPELSEFWLVGAGFIALGVLCRRKDQEISSENQVGNS